MRVRMFVGMAALCGVCTYAGEIKSPKRVVKVCMQWSLDMLILPRAQAIASQIFSEASVKIEWRHDKRSCSDKSGEMIVVHLANHTPPEERPGAFAYALPYEGVTIRVFYDRVKETVKPPRVPVFLAHVLAHEIAHVLQGFPRHSPTGVLKPRWEVQDFDRMAWKPFNFTEEDVRLIHLGLDGRAARFLRSK